MSEIVALRSRKGPSRCRDHPQTQPPWRDQRLPPSNHRRWQPGTPVISIVMWGSGELNRPGCLAKHDRARTCGPEWAVAKSRDKLCTVRIGSRRWCRCVATPLEVPLPGLQKGAQEFEETLGARWTVPRGACRISRGNCGRLRTVRFRPTVRA